INMIKFIVKNKKELEKIVADRMAIIIQKKTTPLFILATGNSPIGVYTNLINKHKNEGLSFKNLISYNLDEYREIDKFPKDSFRNFMNDNLFNDIDINKSNTFFPDDVKKYDESLDKIDMFDFTILGVGTNGHIAFNEPGTSFDTRTNEVELTKSTIKSNFPGRSDYPTSAITMGLHDIYNKSKEIILLAWGEGKRDALNKLKEGVKRIDWPITFFIDHPNMTIVTDLEEFK
ncbi:MAG: glucosamine-6-phosphate deaminase, partial [Mycoplasmataceae bacterium]|nr:glucosamine-6-phosphate deaminase [Mycoplasmataceae bacterium]